MFDIVYCVVAFITFIVLLKLVKHYHQAIGFSNTDLPSYGMLVFVCFSGSVIWPVLLLIIPMAYFGKWYFNR